MDLEKLKLFLTRYTSISEEEYFDLTSMVKVGTLSRNEFLQKEGDVCRRLGYILSGSVRTYYLLENGTEQTTEFHFENQFITDVNSFFTQAPSVFYALTMEPSVILYITHNEFYNFLQKYPHYEPLVSTIIAQEIGAWMNQHRIIRIPSARERYAAFCKLNGAFLHKIPIKYIASYLGITTETLSRVRAGKL